MQQKLRDEVKSIQTVVELVRYRAEYQKYMEALKAKEEEILERERSKLLVVKYIEGLKLSWSN